jgi:hypothetical protein
MISEEKKTTFNSCRLRPGCMTTNARAVKARLAREAREEVPSIINTEEVAEIISPETNEVLQDYMKKLIQFKKITKEEKELEKEKKKNNSKRRWLVGQEKFFRRLELMYNHVSEDMTFCSQILDISSDIITTEQQRTQNEIREIYSLMQKVHEPLKRTIIDISQKRAHDLDHIEPSYGIPD